MCKMLAERLTNGQYIAEELENPFLTPFYQYLKEHPGKENPFSFPLQEHFLEKRFQQELQVQAKNPKLILMD